MLNDYHVISLCPYSVWQHYSTGLPVC